MKGIIKLGFELLLTFVIILVFGFKSKTIAIGKYQKIDSKITGNELFKNNCAASYKGTYQPFLLW